MKHTQFLDSALPDTGEKHERKDSREPMVFDPREYDRIMAEAMEGIE